MTRNGDPQSGPATFGEQVEWIKNELGISWTKFAKDVDVTPETLRRWRNGAPPTSYTTKSVARVDEYAKSKFGEKYPPAPHHQLLKWFPEAPAEPHQPRQDGSRRRDPSAETATVVDELVTPAEVTETDRPGAVDEAMPQTNAAPSVLEKDAAGRGGDAASAEVNQGGSWWSTASPRARLAAAAAAVVVGAVLIAAAGVIVGGLNDDDGTQPGAAADPTFSETDAAGATPTTSVAVPGPPPAGTLPETVGVATGVSVFSTTGGARPSPGVPEKIPYGTVVNVSCYSAGPGGIASTIGFYLVADGPWANHFAPADTFLNGDVLGDENGNTLVDPAVPAC